MEKSFLKLRYLEREKIQITTAIILDNLARSMADGGKFFKIHFTELINRISRTTLFWNIFTMLFFIEKKTRLNIFRLKNQRLHQKYFFLCIVYYLTNLITKIRMFFFNSNFNVTCF
jgi:hypothetical protein